MRKRENADVLYLGTKKSTFRVNRQRDRDSVIIERCAKCESFAESVFTVELAAVTAAANGPADKPPVNWHRTTRRRAIKVNYVAVSMESRSK